MLFNVQIMPTSNGKDYAGMASDRFGGKPVMAVALFSVGFGIFAFGCASSFNVLWTIMFFMGLLEGPSYPTNRVPAAI